VNQCRRDPRAGLVAVAAAAGALWLAAHGVHAQTPDPAAAKAAVVVGAPGASAPAAAPLDPVAAAAERTGALRKKTLKDEDFVESEENRDPFRSYLRLFATTTRVTPTSVKIAGIFDKFALEELTLIAIVSGDENPRAMFRDPSGLGQTIKRGDYLSKNGARVTKILSDRVVVELTEDTGGPDGQRVLEKAILVNPEEAQP